MCEQPLDDQSCEVFGQLGDVCDAGTDWHGEQLGTFLDAELRAALIKITKPQGDTLSIFAACGSC